MTLSFSYSYDSALLSVLISLSLCEVMCLPLPLFIRLYHVGNKDKWSTPWIALCHVKKWKLIKDFSLVNFTVATSVTEDNV